MFGFTPEDPVLDFGPRMPKDHGQRIAWEYILWPAWGYRVVAPRVREKKLNMFQRAALGLCRVEKQDADSIGENLDIHCELAAFILRELMEKGYVDRDGIPTKQGLQVIEEDAVNIQDMVAGYVFQDPWNGDLWPRFVEQLDYCELEFDERGFPSLLFGTAGKPRRQGAFMLLPPNNLNPTQPSPANVVSAVARHRKGKRYTEAYIEYDDDFEHAYAGSTDVAIDSVSFIDETPNPMYLMTYLYLVEFDGDWHVCDPFGFGENTRLRRRVEQVMQENAPFFNVVNRLVGRGIHDGAEERRQWIQRLRKKAELEAEKILTINIRTHAAFDQIIDMEVSRQEAVSLDQHCPDSKINTALRDCSKCLEAIFADIVERYPLGEVWKRVYVSRPNDRKLLPQQDRTLLRETYCAAAREVGFEDPIPIVLSKIKPGHIRSVAEFGETWRLRPMVVACLLAAQERPDHPFHAAARLAPNLLEEIDTIAEQGGSAGHAGGNQATIDNVSVTVERTYAVISALTGLGSIGHDETGKESGAKNG